MGAEEAPFFMDLTFKNLPENKKVYFASDFHLGSPSHQGSLSREKKVISWLNQIQSDAAGIFLVGDIFDFWFEYKHVIPKGYVRFLGKTMELKDQGIPVIFFAGNHDLWMNQYFPDEFGIPVYHQPTDFQIGKFAVHIAHGDGLGPGDRKFKLYKKIFTNPLAQWAFRWFHPDAGIGLAKSWSNHSRAHSIDPAVNGEGQWLITYCEEQEAKAHHDLYIMGHRHVALEHPISNNSTYFNLGEWIKNPTYLEISQNGPQLKSYNG